MSKVDRQREKARSLANADERKRVALRVFGGVDEAGARKLAELAAKGVTPSCVEGCAHCCRLEIPMSRAEGEALVDWLVANRSAEEVDAVRDRLRGWLVWYRTEYPRLIASGTSRVEAFFRHAPQCSLLVDNRCTAYPVRPVACRNHMVSSPASRCDPANGDGEVDSMLDVARATYPHVVELQNVVAKQGGTYLATIHLIAEWLAHLLDVEREPWQGSPPLELR
jgi:Fe-S-cluster containining protein